MADAMDYERLAKQMAAMEVELRVMRERLESLEKAFWGARAGEDASGIDAAQPAVLEAKPPAPEPSVKKTALSALKEMRQAFESSTADKAKKLLEPSPKPAKEPREAIPPLAAKSEIPISPAIVPLPLPLRPTDPEDQSAEQPSARRAFDWRDLLRQWRILPPANEGNVEIQIGAWWATRIGILLAVIGGVFFGIYVSRNTPPWLKFAELCAAGITVTGLGLWLERKLPRFGAVVFAGGLALGYFAIFAGYALPATKVIDSPFVAALLQFLSIAGIVFCAEWRRSHEISTMAVFLGFVSCFFSIHAGLNDFALAASALLGAAAIWFYLKNGWFSPYQLAVPLAYLVYGIVSLFSWSKSPTTVHLAAHRPAPIFAIALSYPLVYMILYGAADYVAMVRDRLMPQRPRRLVQICNTTGAILLGYIVTKTYFADQLHLFYFVFGGVLIAGAVAYYLARPSDIFASIYFAKGSALITLGIIAKYRAQTRWMALLVESFVLLLSAKRSRRLVTEAAMLLVWLVSALYFLNDPHPKVNSTMETLTSWASWLAFLYALASATVLALYGRWFELGQELKENLPRLWGRGGKWISPRTVLILASTVFILGPYICAGMANTYEIADYPTVTFAMVTVGLCLIAGLTRSWIPLLASVFPFLLLHGRVWVLSIQPQSLLWINGAVAIGLTWALTMALFVFAKKRERANLAINGTGVALHILWVLTLSTLYAKTFSGPALLFISTLTSILLACTSLRLPAFALAEVSILPMITGVSACMNGIGNPYHAVAPVSFSDFIHRVLIWLSGLAAFAYAVGFAAISPLRARLSEFGKEIAPWIHTFVAVWAVLVSMQILFDNAGFVLSIQVAAVLVLLLHRWPGLRPALYAALVLTAAAHLAYWNDLLRLPNSITGASGYFLWIPIIAAVLTIAFVPLSLRLVPDMDLRLRKGIVWSHGILALVMLFLAFLFRTGPLANYVTALWGLSATALLVAGLALRLKPFRIIAMVGLALCIPRVFIVDARSTFYRIIAFFAMGFALLVIGLLYNKFRAVIENWEKESL